MHMFNRREGKGTSGWALAAVSTGLVQVDIQHELAEQQRECTRDTSLL
jgi:hypothetical protein